MTPKPIWKTASKSALLMNNCNCSLPEQGACVLPCRLGAFGLATANSLCSLRTHHRQCGGILNLLQREARFHVQYRCMAQ